MLNIFSAIELDGRKYFLSDGQARYIMKESIYHGDRSKFIIFYNPYENINGVRYTTFSWNGESYVEDKYGKFLLNEYGEYYNPLEGKETYRSTPMYVKDVLGDYIYDSTRAAFIDPYKGETRYIEQGTFTYEEDPDGKYLYDPLLDNATNGFYLPYMDKYDHTKDLTRYILIGGKYMEYPDGEYIYDEELDIYYNPYYHKTNQTVKLTRYTIGADVEYIEDSNGNLIYDVTNDVYYNPYEDVTRYSVSDELSTFEPNEDGEYIEAPPFNINARPDFGFYNDFPVWDMDKEEFVLGSEAIFEQSSNPDDPVYISGYDIPDAELELGAIDRINGQSIRDDRKLRYFDYIQLSGGQKYSITNNNDYWMQIFEYKYDEVIKDFIFIKSYKLTYGWLFTLHPMTTHVRVASGAPDTTDLSNVKIRLVTDPNATEYVFSGPMHETFDEAYQNGYVYYFDSNDRSQFCKLIGDGEHCQGYERYQMSQKILKSVSEINDSVNQAMSRITQTGAEISMEVQNTARDLKTYISQQMNVIRLEVIDGDNGLAAKLQLTADALTAMATSEYVVIASELLSNEDIIHSLEHPEEYLFSDIHPSLNSNGIYVMDPETSVKTDYITAYNTGRQYFIHSKFKDGYAYIKDTNGSYIWNNEYYNPYERELANGGHRYTKVISNNKEIYEIDDNYGLYIKLGDSYFNPYEKYERYSKYAVYCKLTYNDIDGYGYDIYTSTKFAMSSLIEQTATQIRLEVSEESGNLVSRIVQTKDEISMEVANLEKDMNAKLNITAEGIEAAVSSGGSEIVTSDPALLMGVKTFSSTRPILKDNSFTFNSKYLSTFDDHVAAYNEGYTYFRYEPLHVYVKFDDGDYILDENGEYKNPYADNVGNRFVKIIDSGEKDEEVSYIKSVSGRYIKVTGDNGVNYIDPYEGKDRYIKLPAYCQIVKIGNSYTANVIISTANKNQTQINQTSKSITMSVTDVNGAYSSISQTANSIKLGVNESNAALNASIEINKDRIEYNTASSVKEIARLTTLPTEMSGIYSWYYSVPPKLSEAALIFNTSRRQQFFQYEDAYKNNYTYYDTGDYYIEDIAGPYIFSSSVNGYINPYDGVDRYVKVIYYEAEDAYKEDPNGEYVRLPSGEYVRIETVTDTSIPVRYKYSAAVVEKVRYDKDVNGRYIVDEYTGDYVDPYIYNGVPRKRYFKYPSYGELIKTNDGYELVVYAFTGSIMESNIEQTSKSIELSISDKDSSQYSTISQDAAGISLNVKNDADAQGTEIAQTAEGIRLLAESGTLIPLDLYLNSTSPIVTEDLTLADIYRSYPPFNQETDVYDFDNELFIYKYRYNYEGSLNINTAFNNGYVYFKNDRDVYIPDNNGDYIKNGNSYVNPYAGATRYTLSSYDYDDENPENSSDYIESEDGRFVYSADKGYYDPYAGKARYLKIDANQTYCKIVSIRRTAVAYIFEITDENQNIDNSQCALMINDTAYVFTPSSYLFTGYEIKYDAKTGRVICSYDGTTSEIISSNRVQAYPSDFTFDNNVIIYNTYDVAYDDMYSYNVFGNMQSSQKASMELSNKEIKLSVEDATGLSSQIKQTSSSITSIVNGAPVLIETYKDTVSTSEATKILNKISRYYKTMPIYNTSQNIFDFTGIDFKDASMNDAYEKQYHYFEVESPEQGEKKVYINTYGGPFIRTEVEQEPEYEYHLPSTNRPMFANFGGIYLEIDPDATNFPSAIYYETVDADGNTVYESPWLNATEEDGQPAVYRLNEDGETYTRITNPEEIRNTDYIRVEIPKDPIYTYSNPYSGVTRYNRIITPNEAGKYVLSDNIDIAIDISSLEDPSSQDQFYKIWKPVNTWDPTDRDLWIWDHDRNVFYRPFFEADDKTPVEIYSTGLNDKNFKVNPYGNLIIDNNGNYVDPLEGNVVYKLHYEKSGACYYVPSSSGTYRYDDATSTYVTDENGSYAKIDYTVDKSYQLVTVGDDDVYVNKYGSARYDVTYLESPNGRFIDDGHGNYYDPYEEHTEERFTPLPVYGRMYKDRNNLWVVKYFTTINDSISSSIEQTGDMIRIAVADEDAQVYSEFYVTTEEIKMAINDTKNELETQISMTKSQIMAYVKDGENKMNSALTIGSESISGLVSGATIYHSSKNTNLGNEAYTRVRRITPSWSNSENKFIHKDETDYVLLTEENVAEALRSGYSYFTGTVVYNSRQGATHMEYTTTNEDGDVIKYTCDPSDSQFFDQVYMDLIIHEVSSVEEMNALSPNVDDYCVVTTDTSVSSYKYVGDGWDTCDSIEPVRKYKRNQESGMWFPTDSPDVSIYLNGELLRTEAEREAHYIGIVCADNATFTSEVPCYFKIVGYDPTTTRLECDAFIRAKSDYQSEIFQAANLIRMQIADIDGRVESYFKMTSSNINIGINNLRNGLTAKLEISEDSIDSLVSGTYVMYEKGTTGDNSRALYNRVPDYDHITGKFKYSGDLESRPFSGSAISEGYKYQIPSDVNASIMLPSLRANATYYSINGTNFYSVVGVTFYKREADDSSVTNETDMSISYKYTADSESEVVYLENGDTPVKFYKDVYSYRKYNSINDYVVYIKSDAEMESKISQTANSITLSIKGETEASLSVAVDKILSVVKDNNDTTKTEIAQTKETISMNAASYTGIVDDARIYYKSGQAYTQITINSHIRKYERYAPILNDDGTYTSNTFDDEDNVSSVYTANHKYVSVATLSEYPIYALIKCGRSEAEFCSYDGNIIAGLSDSTVLYVMEYKYENGKVEKTYTAGTRTTPNAMYIKDGDGNYVRALFYRYVPTYLEFESSSKYKVRVSKDLLSSAAISISADTVSLTASDDNGVKALLNVGVDGNGNGTITMYTNYLTIEGDNVRITNDGIVAKSGELAGWSIKNYGMYKYSAEGTCTGMFATSDTTSVGYILYQSLVTAGKSPVRFFTGSTFNPNGGNGAFDANFMVLEDGSVYCKNIDVTGGNVAGWQASTNVLYKGKAGIYSGNEYSLPGYAVGGYNSPVRFFTGSDSQIGNAGFAPKFAVFDNGEMMCTGGNIGCFKLVTRYVMTAYLSEGFITWLNENRDTYPNELNSNNLIILYHLKKSGDTDYDYYTSPSGEYTFDDIARIYPGTVYVGSGSHPFDQGDWKQTLTKETVLRYVTTCSYIRSDPDGGTTQVPNREFAIDLFTLSYGNYYVTDTGLIQTTDGSSIIQGVTLSPNAIFKDIDLSNLHIFTGLTFGLKNNPSTKINSSSYRVAGGQPIISAVAITTDMNTDYENADYSVRDIALHPDDVSGYFGYGVSDKLYRTSIINIKTTTNGVQHAVLVGCKKSTDAGVNKPTLMFKLNPYDGTITAEGNISSNTSVSALAFEEDSDINKKENILMISDRYDDVFDSMELYEFNFIGNSKVRFGAIAQRVKNNLITHGFKDDVSIMPLYNETKGRISLNYVDMIPLTINQVQRLKSRVTQLENELKDLKAKLK